MLVKGSVEDFIYILIGIVWIAFSIYKGIKGSQKKKSEQLATEDSNHDQTERASETSVKKSVFDSFLEEITRDDEVIPPIPEEVIEEKKHTARFTDNVSAQPFSYDDFYEESNYKSKTDVYDDERAATKPTKQKELYTYLQKRRRPRIDLKKAVIYSEILNRRYF